MDNAYTLEELAQKANNANAQYILHRLGPYNELHQPLYNAYAMVRGEAQPLAFNTTWGTGSQSI